MKDKTPLQVLFTWLTIVKERKYAKVCQIQFFLHFAIFSFQWLLFDSFMISKLKNVLFLHVSTKKMKKKSTLKY